MKPYPVLDPARPGLYSLYVIALSLLANRLDGALKAVLPQGLLMSTLITITVYGVLFLSIRFWYSALRRQWQMNRGPARLNVTPKSAMPAQALIALCGPSPAGKESTNPAFEAATQHRGALRHLWLITSHGGRETAEWIRLEVSRWNTDAGPVTVHEPIVLDDMGSVDLVKAKVEATRNEAIDVYRLDENEVLCDFTGMTKPATAGMVLACAPRGRRLSYLQGQYDAAGKLIFGAPSRAIEIEIEYQVEGE